MTINTRTVTLISQWAATASTTIPNPPVPGQAYRNVALTASTVQQGQNFSAVADSAAWNQFLWNISGLVQAAENWGIMPYSPLTTYQPGALTLGPDGVLYQSIAASGPGVTAGAQPTTNTTYWQNYITTIAPQPTPPSPLATPSTADSPGEPGLAVYAKFSDMSANNKAVTPFELNAVAQTIMGMPPNGFQGSIIYFDYSDSTYQPPTTGWYRVTCTGGGGGGGSGALAPGASGTPFGGGGGGGGFGATNVFMYTFGVYYVIVGGGGAGSPNNATGAMGGGYSRMTQSTWEPIAMGGGGAGGDRYIGVNFDLGGRPGGGGEWASANGARPSPITWNGVTLQYGDGGKGGGCYYVYSTPFGTQGSTPSEGANANPRGTQYGRGGRGNENAAGGPGSNGNKGYVSIQLIVAQSSPSG